MSIHINEKLHPQAQSLHLGMQLMAHSHSDVNRINKIIEDGLRKQITQLEAENEYLRPLAKKFLALKKILADDPEPLA